MAPGSGSRGKLGELLHRTDTSLEPHTVLCTSAGEPSMCRGSKESEVSQLLWAVEWGGNSSTAWLGQEGTSALLESLGRGLTSPHPRNSTDLTEMLFTVTRRNSSFKKHELKYVGNRKIQKWI